MVVTRKYLCPAPHPSTWDERAEALLKSLGGSQKKREQILRQTLTVLRATRPPEKKRTGPGRKSNAEHAINFYQHVLELNMEETTGEESQEKGNDDKKASPRPTKRLKQQDDDDDDATSTSTGGTQEFLEQHNDFCEVCNLGGELLCCNTCNLVFHMKCSKPSLQKVPSDNWNCSYCIASGTTGHKRNTHIRRRAQAACREMDRMRVEPKENKQPGQQKSKADEDKEDSEKKPAADGTTIARDSEEGVNLSESAKDDESLEAKGEESSSESANTGEEKKDKSLTPPSPKKNLDEDDSIFELEDANQRRARRERRRTTLYDPQQCAASEWRSDGILEWKYLADDEKDGPPDGAEDDEEEGSKTESDANDVEKAEEKTSTSSDGPVWCSFCKDDPSIPICCFCACRVCFGKHDAGKLLLCDKCDNEYHTFCLNPPLVSVPVARKWYCPSCKASMRKSKAETSPAAKAKRRSAKKSPGRPKSTSPPQPSSPSPRKRARGPDGRFSFKTPPKKRGRPRKNQSPTPTKPRRGRPPKSPKSPSTPKRSGASKPAKSTKNSATKRKEASKTSKETDGSARRVAPTAASGAGTTKQNKTKAHALPTGTQSTTASSTLGPQKDAWKNVQTALQGAHPTSGASTGTHPAALSSSMDQTSGAAPAAPGPSTISRSGRKVKRNSFHDELYEGDQHLRVVKRKVPTVDRPNKKGQESAEKLQTSAAQNPSALAAPSLVPPALSTLPSSTGSQLPSSGQQPLSSTAIQHSAGSASATKTVPAVSAKPATVAASLQPQPASSSNSGITPVLNTAAAMPNTGGVTTVEAPPTKVPRRKPGARECMQISRRFGVNTIPQKYMDTLLDYCTRGKVEHLIRMRERLDEHSRMLEANLAALEITVKEKGELDITVPPAVQEGDAAAPGPTGM